MDCYKDRMWWRNKNHWTSVCFSGRRRHSLPYNRVTNVKYIFKLSLCASVFGAWLRVRGFIQFSCCMVQNMSRHNHRHKLNTSVVATYCTRQHPRRTRRCTKEENCPAPSLKGSRELRYCMKLCKQPHRF